MTYSNTPHPWLVPHGHSVKIIYTICSGVLLYEPCDHKNKCLRLAREGRRVKVRV